MLKKIIYRVAKLYIRWADGFSYNFSKNGEKWILEATSNLEFSTIFDVGANVGSWTKEAIGNFANANFHCFELSEDTFKTLRSNITSQNASLNNLGLSNESAKIEYKDYGKNSGFNTILVHADFHDNRIKPAIKRGTVIKGDDYCENNGIGFIDFLKIDVEGAEHLVLQGFTEMLSEKKIRIVQFEYGYTHGDAKFLMRDFYQFFEECGYIVGKLRRGKVDFIDWSYQLNDFNSGPNYIAIRATDKELFNVLSR